MVDDDVLTAGSIVDGLAALSADDAAFLRELGEELRTQDTCCQADPRFWVVRETVWEACWEEDADRYSLVEDGEVIGILDDYRMDLPGGLSCVPERRVERVVPDTFFLTLRECREYISRNRHNLFDDPHPYAMTAVRSPQVERLWKVLQATDWQSADHTNVLEEKAEGEGGSK